MRAIRLRTEYLYEPVGMDIVKPRFYWNCETEKEGDVQTAYQIVAKREGEVVWDSGKVASERMTHVVYEGPQLHSRDRIVWKVKLWDKEEREEGFEESFFEMGLLEPEDWKAKWISGDYRPKKDRRYPVDCFRKRFSVSGKCVGARLYISACGLYEARLNGEKAGKDCFTPGCTDYRKRIQYQTYDVAKLLKKGEENVLEVELADGWYRGSINAFGQTEVYGRQTSFICQLEMTMEDGSRQVVISDDSFSWSDDGPYRFADFKDGEICDKNRQPSYQGKAVIVKKKIVPVSANNVMVREKECFPAKLIITPSGRQVLDFGQNLAGFVDIRMKGAKGQKVCLRMGEILDENGELTLKNIQCQKPARNFNMINQLKTMTGQYDKIKEELALTPKQEVELILSGGEDHYRTRYALFGFRYAEVLSGEKIRPEDFHAVAVYSDMEETGSFSCSNEKVNRFWLNTLWSMKSNYLDIPTDCPTRERLGWTGDAQIFFNTAAYFYDTASFFRKWLADLEDSQYKDGLLPAVCPYAGMEMLYKGTGASVGWQDAGILIPYRYYKVYRDQRILERYYPMMKRCAEFMIKKAGPKFGTKTVSNSLSVQDRGQDRDMQGYKNEKQQEDNPYSRYMYVKGVQLGEWLEPKEFNEPVSAGSMPEHPEECTAYMYYSMSVMARTAEILGETEDGKRYREYRDGAKKAYLWMCFKNGVPDTDRQAKLVRPLALGLADDLTEEEMGFVPSDLKKQLQERLAKAVENYRFRVGTGFLSTAFLLPELTRMGRNDIAYRMLENEEMPGWLAEVNEGATTVWENWDGEASHNHYSPGTVCEWLFSVAAGIQVDGENHFRIEPVQGGSLRFVRAAYKSMYGEVRVQWEKDGALTVTVPANTKALVIWNGKRKECGSGTTKVG